MNAVYNDSTPEASVGIVSALHVPERPRALSVQAGNIPDMLKQQHAWVCWRYVWDGTKWRKVPFQPDRRPASSTDPATWSSFDVVMSAYGRGKFDGIGFALDGRPDDTGLVLAGVDLDDVTDSPERMEWARQIVAEFGSYTEWSPSGEGLRIFGFAKPLPRGINRDGIELYTSGRYLTVTGHVFGGIA